MSELTVRGRQKNAQNTKIEPTASLLLKEEKLAMKNLQMNIKNLQSNFKKSEI